MLHRIKKEKDINKDKWIGIGGHFESGESPEECLLRETLEETGLTLTSYRFRGIVTFLCDDITDYYMCLYTADGFTGTLKDCSEGTLEWVQKDELTKLNLWEGDLIFFRLLKENAPFFSLKLCYRNNVLTQAALNGKQLELFDIIDETGRPTGQVRERSLVHLYGDRHRTSHIWIVRPSKIKKEGFDVLLQKRANGKESFPGCYDISSACSRRLRLPLFRFAGIRRRTGDYRDERQVAVHRFPRCYHTNPFLWQALSQPRI
jgi:8-oxo-dGTP diphosphatase